MIQVVLMATLTAHLRADADPMGRLAYPVFMERCLLTPFSIKKKIKKSPCEVALTHAVFPELNSFL